jgi:Fe-S-cluster-containing dehydrogenase component/DMSO reductase anchor subunit
VIGQALFTLDLNRCTGCSACAIACGNENPVGQGLSWRSIHTFNAARHPAAPVHHLSLACNHCRDPACMRGCPAAAYRKDPRTGAVLLDGDRCIGCGYCAWVCPYDAPQLNPATGVMEKCTFCSHRLDEGLDPACVTACPVDALGFEVEGDPGGWEVPGFPDTGLGPAIRITPRRGATAAVTTRRETTATPNLSRLRSDWPLLVFSVAVTCLVAWFTATQVLGTAVAPVGFVGLGLLALGVSTAHVGRPLRAWRAVLNLRTSWVSREIVAVSAFFWTASAVAVVPGLPGALGRLAVALGFVALFCVDMVYRVPGQRVRAVPHAAMTTLTGIFLLGLMLEEPLVVLPAAALKLALYPFRGSLLGGLPALTALLRLGFGFVAPLVVWLVHPEPFLVLLVGSALVGEIVDRVRFYAELEFAGPAREIAATSP